MPSQTHARAPRSDAAKNRAALLDAARVELNRDPDASLDAIAAAAGLTRRAVYGHFASRDALVAELAALGAARVAAAVDAIHDADPVLDLALIGRLVWDDVEHVRAMTRSVVRGPLREQVLMRGSARCTRASSPTSSSRRGPAPDAPTCRPRPSPT